MLISCLWQYILKYWVRSLTVMWDYLLERLRNKDGIEEDIVLDNST